MKFISERDDFKIRNNILVCLFCNKELTYVVKEGTKTLKKHLETKKHIENKSRVLEMKTLTECCSLKVINKTFDERLVEAFAAANIPLYKLQNTVFKTFMEEYTNKMIHDESYYRKLLLPVFEKKRSKIFESLRNKDVYILFDETTDINGKYILNIMSGVCGRSSRENTYLIRTVELTKTNSETIGQEIINVMSEIYDGKIEFNRLRLVLSDGASYALKAVKALKLLFLNLKHVTCIAHMLHRLCEKVRDISPISNNIASQLKRILIKNREHQSFFQNIFGRKLPKFPVLTRWGTWISFLTEIADNFNKYKSFIQYIATKNNEYVSIEESFHDVNFIEELKEIKKNSFLIESIIQLEKNNLSSKQQMDILKEVIKRIENPILIEKLSILMAKNPDLSFFSNLNEISCNEAEKSYLFVPLTTVDVERSFSKMVVILDDLRRGMTVKMQEILCFLYFNKD
ncbi:hypothetical protein DMUE_5633 [Dictyocoela muelleri]|nr:hypothetical protein DMUE_5633 [Dictyocoela muelleri]